AYVRHHLAGEFQFAKAKRAATALAAAPGQKKPHHLPERVEPEAPRHDGIALEMAAEKPEIRFDIEFGADQPLAIFAAGSGNFADAVEHQHRRQWQLRIALAKNLAPAARQQIFIVVTAAPRHVPASLNIPMKRSDPLSSRKHAKYRPLARPPRVRMTCGNRRSPLQQLHKLVGGPLT